MVQLFTEESLEFVKAFIIKSHPVYQPNRWTEQFLILLSALSELLEHFVKYFFASEFPTKSNLTARLEIPRRNFFG